MTTAGGYVFNILHAQCFRVNSSGVGVGQLDPSSLSNGTTSHAYKLKGTGKFNPGNASYRTVDFRAGGAPVGKADLGLETLPSDMTLEVADYDATLDALLMGGAVDTTSITNVTVSSTQHNRKVTNRVGWLLTGQVQSNVTATLSQNYYFTYLIPSSTCRVSDSPLNDDGGTNPTNRTITITPQMATKFPTGIAFGSNQSFEENREYLVRLVAEYPFALTAFIQDAAATTYILGYRPAHSTVTNGITNSVYAVGGVATAPSSVSTTTAVVTLAAAGSAAVIDVALYQTAFTAI